MRSPTPHDARARAAEHAAGIVAFVVLLAACAYLEARDWVYPWARTHEIGRAAIVPERGHAYVIPIPEEYKSLRATLLEGSKALGPGEQLHDAIRTQGGGRFSVWPPYLYFSSSDNSDPRANGRTYVLELRSRASERARFALWLMCAGLGGVLLARAGRASAPAATATWLVLGGAILVLLWRGLGAAFDDLKLAETYGTAWMPYSDALGPWFLGGVSFLFGLPPPDFLYRPTIGIFWASLLAVGQRTQFIPFFFCAWLLALLAVALSTGRDEKLRQAIAIGVGTAVMGFAQTWHGLYISSLVLDFPSLVLTLTGVVLLFRGDATSRRATLLAGCLCLGVAAAIRGPMLAAGPILIAARLLLVDRAGVRLLAACAALFAAPFIVDVVMQRQLGVTNNGIVSLYCIYSDPARTWTGTCHAAFLAKTPAGAEVFAAALSFFASDEGRAWLLEVFSKRLNADFRLLTSLPTLGLVLFAGIVSSAGPATAQESRGVAVTRTLAVVACLLVAGEIGGAYAGLVWIAIGLAAAAALRSWRSFGCLAAFVAGTAFLCVTGLVRYDRLQQTFAFTLPLALAFLVVDSPRSVQQPARRFEWALPAAVASAIALLYGGFLFPNAWRDSYLREVHLRDGHALKVADDPRIDRSLYYTGHRGIAYTRHDELAVGTVRRYKALTGPQSSMATYIVPYTFVD